MGILKKGLQIGLTAAVAMGTFNLASKGMDAAGKKLDEIHKNCKAGKKARKMEKKMKAVKPE